MRKSDMSCEKNHIASFDGLRALAIIAVVGFHGNWVGFEGGGFGVDLFFVLSGFLITWLLLKEKQKYGQISIKEFYFRRVLRIVPAYVLFLLGYYLLALFVFRESKPQLVVSTLASATYTTNIAFSWFDLQILQVHTWSLSMEEQFYLLFPAMVARMSQPGAIRVIFALLVIAPLWRLTLFLSFDVLNTYRIEFGPDTRYDSILWGCLLAFVYTGQKLKEKIRNIPKKSVLLAGLMLIGVSIMTALENKLFKNTIGYSVISLGFCLILWYFLNETSSWATKILSCKSMVFVGTLSYSLYLWHLPMVGLANRVRLRLDPYCSEFGAQLFYVAASMIAAMVSYYLIERPFLQLKRERHTMIEH